MKSLLKLQISLKSLIHKTQECFLFPILIVLDSPFPTFIFFQTKNKYSKKERKKIVGINNFLTASNLLKTYLSYLESIPIWSGTNSISDFLQFNWRDLSSGEKAMLDIFSRMYHAKRLSIEKQEKKAKWYWKILSLLKIYLWGIRWLW